MGKMPFILVTSGKNAPSTVVVRVSPLHTAKKIIGILQLAPPSRVGPRTMQALLKEPLQPLEEHLVKN